MRLWPNPDDERAKSHEALDLRADPQTAVARPKGGVDAWTCGMGEPMDPTYGPAGGIYVSAGSGVSGIYAGPEGIKRTYRRRLTVRNRSLTLSGPIGLLERATEDELEDHRLEQRPLTRADCASGYRPCPWVSCRHHLYVEVNPVTGSVQLPFGSLGIDEIPRTCSLDAADDGPLTLEEVGKLTSRTKERIRQIEIRAMTLIRPHGISPSMLDARMADWMDF